MLCRRVQLALLQEACGGRRATAPTRLLSLVHSLHYCWVTLMLLSHTTSSTLVKPLLLKKICRFAVLSTGYIQTALFSVVNLKAVWNGMLLCSSGALETLYFTGASPNRLFFSNTKPSLTFTSSTSHVCNTNSTTLGLAG